MTNMSKYELIKATKPRYLKSSKKEKGVILDEFCASTGYDRKYAIQIFKASFDNNRVKTNGRKARKRKYSSKIICIVIKVWELLDYPCGTRLKSSLIPTLEAMIKFNEISVSKEDLNKLETISAKTLDRRLKKEREIKKLNRNREIGRAHV